MRIDYGLPQTSISSLLSQNTKELNAQESTQNPTQESADKSNQKSAKNTNDLRQVRESANTKQTQKPSKIHNDKPTQESQQNTEKNIARQTYGMEILALMSDEEYSAFVKASEGMSEGEKVIAAQSLYSLRKDYQGQGAPQNAKNPYTKTNRAFGRHSDFLERYKAFYYGVEKVEILG